MHAITPSDDIGATAAKSLLLDIDRIRQQTVEAAGDFDLNRIADLIIPFLSPDLAGRREFATVLADFMATMLDMGALDFDCLRSCAEH